VTQEDQAILKLIDSIDAIEVMPLPRNLLDTVKEQLKPRIRLVQIQEQSQFHFLHSLLLLVVGVVFGISLSVLWRAM
jgi:hypothetical protein